LFDDKSLFLPFSVQRFSCLFFLTFYDVNYFPLTEAQSHSIFFFYSLIPSSDHLSQWQSPPPPTFGGGGGGGGVFGFYRSRSPISPLPLVLSPSNEHAHGLRTEMTSSHRDSSPLLPRRYDLLSFRLEFSSSKIGNLALFLSLNAPGALKITSFS